MRRSHYGKERAIRSGQAAVICRQPPEADIPVSDTEKELAVKSVQDKMIVELQKKETEIQMVKRELETQIQAVQLQGNLEKEKLEAALRLKDEELQQVKDFKAKLSTKALGESLEQHCQNEFNRIRMTAFPGAYFEKDNDATSGSKGDYIFRETVDGVEILSVMFDMKTEADETVTKRKNEDFFAKLDKDTTRFSLCLRITRRRRSRSAAC